MTGTGSARFVDPRTIADLLAKGEATLVDVREPGEFAAERIQGARLVPLSAFDPARAQPAPGTQLVLHCAAGIRCGAAAQKLRASGYEGEILRMDGGIKAWRAEGLPVER
ncbi:MAG: rhodanese-like domain-containing protein [Alphaproteobacteria bacterium]|nr:rhodanese-like domain-containing protein [Alphaproteobacteria bacterium]